jgi:hypothetical protein
MFTFKNLTGRLRGARAEISPRRKRRFCGSIDLLEGRQLLSTYGYEVAAAAVGANTSYELQPGGELYEHVGTNSNAGWIALEPNVTQISAGITANGQNAVYAVLTNSQLVEITPTGHYLLASGVSQISASQFQGNTVFAVIGNGALYEITGTGGNSPLYLRGGVSQISAGRDSAGHASVFALSNNNVFEEDTSSGWRYIDNGSFMGHATEISASQIQANTAFVFNSSGGVLEYDAAGSLTSYRYLTHSGASAIASGRDPSGSASVYYIESGTLYEITTKGTYFVASNSSILDPGSGAQDQTDTIYTYGVLFNNRTDTIVVTLDEFIGNSSRAGYDVGYYITSFA